MLEPSQPLQGLCYGIVHEINEDGNRGLTWKQCVLFSPDEVESIKNAADILGIFFSNVERLNAVKDALDEYNIQLHNTHTDSRFSIAVIDRRFRAYVMEWKLFLDHWKKYIDDGAQTEKWPEGSEKQKYIEGYKDLYKRITTEQYDNCEADVIAHAIRNHVVHAENSINYAHIEMGGNEVFISREALLTEANISASQREVIQKQPEKINLSKVGEGSLKAVEKIMDELIRYQINDDVRNAATILVSAFQKINDTGIKADFWMFFDNPRVIEGGMIDLTYRKFEFDQYIVSAQQKTG